MSKTFCAVPWSSLSLTPSGDFRICCFSDALATVPTDEGGAAFNVANGGLAQFWNGKAMRSLRRDMLEGRENEVCKGCYDRERATGHSPRLDMNRLSPPLPPAADGTAPLVIRALDLRFGNLCNMRCRMCSPNSSHLWLDEWDAAFPKEALSPAKRSRLASMNWFEDDASWADLLALLDGVETVNFAGGEPLLAAAHRRFLRACIERGVASRIALNYTTNGTLASQEVIDLWSAFRSVSLFVSVDGVGDLHRYIRFPGAWSQLDRNIRLFVERGYNVALAATAQMYNVTRLKPLIAYAGEIGCVLNVGLLSDPACFSVTVLPAHLKANVRAALRDEPVMRAMLDMMDSRDDSHLLPEFFRVTDVLDQSRGQRLAAVLPELDALRQG